MECLDNLESGVQSKDSVSEDYEEPEMPGHFVSNIDRVCINCYNSDNNNIDNNIWLPIHSRIIFKFCTMAYQTLSSGDPSYLFSLLSLAPKPREPSSSGFHLSVPRIKTHAGNHAFSVAIPKLFGIHSLNMLSHQIA